MATKKKTEKKVPARRPPSPQSVIQHSVRIARGKVTEEIKQAVIGMVKLHGDVKTTFFLKNRGFDEKDIEAMVKAGVKATKAED